MQFITISVYMNFINIFSIKIQDIFLKYYYISICYKITTPRNFRAVFPTKFEFEFDFSDIPVY